MLVGYARVSTAEQTLALQQDALTKASCQRIFTDIASGSHVMPPGLDSVHDLFLPSPPCEELLLPETAGQGWPQATTQRRGLDGLLEAARLVRQEGRAPGR